MADTRVLGVYTRSMETISIIDKDTGSCGYLFMKSPVADNRHSGQINVDMLDSRKQTLDKPDT